MKTTKYKGFKVYHLKPNALKAKTYYRIFKNGDFKQTSSSLKSAKNTIDFNVRYKIW